MNLYTKNIKNMNLTKDEEQIVIYNNLQACRKMLCVSMGENISTCRAKIFALQKYIYN